MEEQLEHPRPPARKGSRILRLLAEMWPAYLIEVIVIILGITITLALEEWRDGQKEDRLAAVYLKNLKADIDSDRQTLAYAIKGSTAVTATGNVLLYGQPSPVVTDTGLRSLLARPGFTTRDATFSDLKSSGNLHLIADISLKNLLFTYYSLTQTIKETQDAEKQAVIDIAAPYLFHRFALDGGPRGAGAQTGGPRAVPAPGDNEFRNIVLLRVDNRRELLDDYRRADSLAARITAAMAE
jgi:hypothetical protein